MDGQGFGELFEIAQAIPEEASFGFLPGEFESPQVRGAGLGERAKPFKQVCSGGVGQVIGCHFFEVEDGIDQFQPSAGAVPHGQGDGPIERHDGRGMSLVQQIVKGHNLGPVCGLGLGASACTRAIAA